jgi:hypothetical protein
MDKTQANTLCQAKLKALLGAFCVWLFACMSIMASSPQVYSPFSLPVAIPALIISILELAPILTVMLGGLPLVLVYVLCVYKGLLAATVSNQTIQESNLSIGNLSVVLVTFSALVSVLINALSFQDGLQYHGLFHTLMIYCINLLGILSLPVMYWRHFKKASVNTYIAFYAVYFSWLGFSAFPWLGDLL